MSAKDDQKIPVIEIFGPTIQGEGMVIGRRTYFIRFGGCDYKCTKCDSMHAVDSASIQALATYLTQEEIYDKLVEFVGHFTPGDMLTFSGGNPALWELGDLVDSLHSAGVLVAIETQGTYYKPWINSCDIVTISPKGPGMGEKFKLKDFEVYIDALRHHPGLNIKVVVFSAQDIQFAIDIQEVLNDKRVAPPFFLSAGNSLPPGLDGEVTTSSLRDSILNEARIVAEEILSEPKCSRMIFLPQWHVLLWGNRQGV